MDIRLYKTKLWRAKVFYTDTNTATKKKYVTVCNGHGNVVACKGQGI